MKKILLGSLILCSLILNAFSKENTSQLTLVNPGQFEWQIAIPQQNQIKYTENGIEYPGWNTTIDEFGYTIPVLSKMVYTLSAPPTVNVSFTPMRQSNFLPKLTTVEESAKGLEYLVKPLPMESSLSGYYTKLIQSTGNQQLWAVSIMGARFDQELGQLLLPEAITVNISTDIKSLSTPKLDGLYLNDPTMSSPDRIQSTQDGYGQGKIKLQVLEDGIYRISYASLKETTDFPQGTIESETITLINKGEEQPIYVHDGGDGVFNGDDYFDFIGKQNYYTGSSQYFDPFSDINLYWLDWGVNYGRRFIEESGALIDSDPVRPTSFWDETHIEEDLIFDRLGQVDTDLPSITRDHYFWNTVNSGQTKEMGFYLADPDRGATAEMEISVGLHGLTYPDPQGGGGGEHSLTAFVNQNIIGEAEWTDQEEFVLVAPSKLNLSHSILNASGTNSLEVFSTIDTTAGVYDRIVLNWLEIGYEHLLKAHENKLRFRKSDINPSTNLEYAIRGFTSPNMVIYKEGLSKITGYTIREIWGPSRPTFNLVFQDVGTNSSPDYWTSTVETLLEPLDITVDTLASLREQDGDLIVITVPAFMEDLDDYLAFKESEGWNPVAVSLRDIYDEFNYGIKSPFAIRSFLKYANNNWPSSPEYVLLIGDAIADPQEAKQDVDLKNIPTFYMQTYAWGAAEADYWYALINGDDYLPDLHLGRIPCDDVDDLENSLNKLIHYGTTIEYGAWQNEIITIAGFETTFKYQSESLLNNEIPKEYMPSRLYVDRGSEGQIFWGDKDTLISIWNDGKLLINFLGHGGGAVWADRSLFVRDDIVFLESETPPAFVTSMTCFTGSFALNQGLGEVVLTKSPAGAIGWFGSSGVGWKINDFLMVQPLLRRLLEEHKTVGELIDIARVEYYLSNSGFDYLKPSMLFQYNYLGDPTLRLKLPEKAELAKSDKDIYSRSDTLNINYLGENSGTVKVLPINAEGQPWWSEPTFHSAEITNRLSIEQEDVVYDSTTIIYPTSGESRTIFTLDRGPTMPAIQSYAPYSINSDWFEHRPPTSDELEQSPTTPLRVRYRSYSESPAKVIITFTGENTGEEDLVAEGDDWVFSDLDELISGISRTYYYFTAFDEDDHFLLKSDQFRLYLPREIGLSLNSVSDSALVNMSGLLFQYTLQGLNQGIAHFTHFDSSSNYRQHVAQDILVKKGNNTFFIPSYFGGNEVVSRSTLELDTNAVPEKAILDTLFTPTHYQIIPGLGISYSGTTSDSVELWPGDNLFITSPDSAWISIKTYTADLGTVTGLDFDDSANVYQIAFSNPNMSVELDSDRSLFLEEPGINTWQMLEKPNGNYELDGIGIFATGKKVNTTGPEVSMMMEGQLFFDGDYILENSRLNLLAEDESGFTWMDEDVEILIDGTPTTIQLGDTTEAAQVMGVSASLDLSVGEHQIAYRVSDALNNWSEEQVISAVVAGSPEVIDYGNFPNPFAGETLIIYELTQPLTNVVIDIYTLSGYKLFSIDEFNARVGIPLGAIGYHEVPWNGRDRNEDFVANGVYFYRIRGEIDGEDLFGSVGEMVKNR